MRLALPDAAPGLPSSETHPEAAQTRHALKERERRGNGQPCRVGTRRRGDGALMLTVITLNLRFDTPRDGLHAWPHRQEAVGSLLRAQAPLLIGTQEGLAGQLEELSAQLPGCVSFGMARHSPGQRARKRSPRPIGRAASSTPPGRASQANRQPPA